LLRVWPRLWVPTPCWRALPVSPMTPGTGRGGHDSELAFATFLPGGFDHATYGADVVLAPLNLTSQVLDAVRQHSWKLAAPATPEGEILAWADRIAYVVSDFQDAVHAGVVTPDQLPALVRERAGTRPSAQIRTFISALVAGTLASGTVGHGCGHGAGSGCFPAFQLLLHLPPPSRGPIRRNARWRCCVSWLRCSLTARALCRLCRPGAQVTGSFCLPAHRRRWRLRFTTWRR